MKLRMPGTSLPPKGRAVPWRFVDLVGDVHGCLDELRALLRRMDYAEGDDGAWRHPGGRRLVFVGDLCNRGPDTLGVLDLVAASIRAGSALLVLGNHDRHVLRWLRGRVEARDEDLATTAAAYAALPEREREERLRRHRRLLRRAPLWALLDPKGGDWGLASRDYHESPGRAGDHAAGDPAAETARRRARQALGRAGLAVAHAAWRPEVVGAAKKRARRWCLYGPTLPRDPETGRRPRLDWTTAYPASAPPVVHGHTAFNGPARWRGRTLCIDTGCAYGGALTALRWPARTLLREPARRTYFHHLDLRPRPYLVDPRAEDLGAEMIALAEGARLR